jgi:hypothetical protein
MTIHVTIPTRIDIATPRCRPSAGSEIAAPDAISDSADIQVGAVAVLRERNSQIHTHGPHYCALQGCLTGKSVNSCPAPPEKIFRFARRANHLYNLAPSRPTQRGVSRSSQTLGGDAVDADARWTSDATADGKAVWS